MKSLFLSAIKSAVSAWLKTGGCDLSQWAPGAALFHYLEGSGKDLDLNQFPYVEKIAAIEIGYSISEGRVSENGLRVNCSYSSANAYGIYMQTSLPDIGVFYQQFNELTATIGGYTAVDKGDHYLIVDRYDWYGVEDGVDIPPVVGKFIKQVPKPVIDKLGLIPNPTREGWFTMNQENLRWVGKSFNSILRVDKKLVTGERQKWSDPEEVIVDDLQDSSLVEFDGVLNSPEDAMFNGDIGSDRDKTPIACCPIECYQLDGMIVKKVLYKEGDYVPAMDIYKERNIRGRRRERYYQLVVLVPYGLSTVWAKAEPIPDPDLEEDYED